MTGDPGHEELLDALRELVGADHASIELVEPDVDHPGLVLLAERGLDPGAAQARAAPSADAPSVSATALREGRRVVIPDVADASLGWDAGLVRSFTESAIRAIWSMPLITRDGRSVGVLSATWRSVHAPDARELRLLDLLATQATDLLEHDRVDTLLREAEARQAFLLELSDALRFLAEPAAIIGEACRLLGRHLDVDRAYYVELDEAAGIARVERDHRRGDPPSLTGTHRIADLGWVIPPMRRDETLVIPDVLASPLIPPEEQPAMAAIQIGAHVNAPLVKGGVLVGALCVTEPEPRAWTPAEVALVEETAERIWAAIERARAEAAFREGESLNRALFEALDEGACLIEPMPPGPDGRRDYRYVAMNPAMQAMFGVPDLTGRTIREFFPDEDDAWYDDYTRVLETGVPLRFERESVPQDKVLDMFVTRVEHGTRPRLLAVMRDVTPRRRAEAVVRASEARLRSVLDASLDAIFRIDLQTGRYDYASPSTEAVIGRSAEELASIGLEGAVGLVHPDDRDLAERALRTLQADGRVAVDCRVLGTDGRVRWLSCQLALTRGPDGQPHHLSGSIRDVSASREMELRRQVAERLLADERERQLAEERARREAAEAFLAVMSHELKTPVTSIYGTAAILARTPGRADAAELAQDIEEESERLLRIVDDLLVLSGVDRGLLRVSPEPLLLGHVLDEVMGRLRRRFPDAVLVAHLPPGVPAVSADPTAVRQILTNLLSNAVKYAGRFGPIEVSLAAREDSLEVVVRDHGPGLGDDPERVFGLYYRAPHTARTASGTGIGLYVAQQLAAAMGGTLVAANAPDAGAVFRLSLPLREDE